MSTSSPDRPTPGGTRFGDVRWVAETGSTNADVLDLARQGEPEGIVVVADHQTAGRGRRGRRWEAPAGASLMCTVLLRPPSALVPMVTMAASLAMAEAIESRCGVAVALKWPNDLVWPGDGRSVDRKVAGILAEAEWPASSTIAGGWPAHAGRERVAVAVGIGVNVAWGDSMPDDLAATAVALDEILAAPDGGGSSPAPDRSDLLAAYLERLDVHYGSLVRGSKVGSGVGSSGPAAVRAAWEARSATIGRRVRVDLGSDDLEGVAVGTTDDGHLVVDTVEGGRRTVAVGDVVHLRPLT